MYTYVLRVSLIGSSPVETVQKVELLLKESLSTDFCNNNRMLKDRMELNLPQIFGPDEFFRLWVDSMWRSSSPEKKSFFVNLMVQDGKHIIITAEYKDIITLRDVAALRIAQSLQTKEYIQALDDIPKCLYKDILKFR